VNSEELSTAKNKFAADIGEYAHYSWYTELGKVSLRHRYAVVFRFISAWLEKNHGILVANQLNIPQQLEWVVYSPDKLVQVARWCGVQARFSDWKKVVERQALSNLHQVPHFSAMLKEHKSAFPHINLPLIDPKIWNSTERIDNEILSTGISILLSLCNTQTEISSRLRLIFPKDVKTFQVSTDHCHTKLCEIIASKLT
jgi:hypothetical protein